MVAEHVLCAVPPHVISSAFPQWMHIAYIFRAIKPGKLWNNLGNVQ